MDPQQHRHQPLKAAGLNNILNKEDHPPNGNYPHQLRDSGFYSTTEASSKHTSAASFQGNGLSPTASGYHSSTDKTPSPIAHNVTTPQAALSPTASNMSVASMVSPTSGNMDPRRFDRPTSLETQQNHSQTTLGENMAPIPGSRRESVDSRINQGFSDMRLAASPYASNNQSTTSIQNSLHAQRNPRPGLEALSVHRISNGYAPGNERNPEPKLIRTAPAITGPATGTIARAAEPTKGQAWAFPEEEIQREQYDGSRRSSITESIASSQFTTESRLPPGQRRLDDGHDYARMHKPSTDFSPPLHHLALQHKQLSDLQEDDMNGAGNQPYSRTPELRVSHKLAERKRRTEMKELFDALRDEMPQERGSKASKWEILTKAINEHRSQKDSIKALSGRCHMLENENNVLRHELRQYQYREGGAPPPQHLVQQQQQPAPIPQGIAQGQAPGYPVDHYANSSQTKLPPLHSISNNVSSGPESMTGIQFEAPATHAYR